MNKRHEQILVNSILTLLTYKKVLHVHVRNTGAVIRRGDGSLTFGRSMFSQKGVPDILAWRGGKSFGLECKSPTGRVSPEQKEWLERFEKEGGVGRVIRSIDEVLDLFGINGR
jgi:VRR-NUC domain-containing protein